MENRPTLYSATYSGIAVLECVIKGVQVMLRRSDRALNATQILKLAGIDKARRTRILERVIQLGPHEKVQGGYGKYQGTWVSFERGAELARDFGVNDLLQSLLEFDESSKDSFISKGKALPEKKDTRKIKKKVAVKKRKRSLLKVETEPQEEEVEEKKPRNEELEHSCSDNEAMLLKEELSIPHPGLITSTSDDSQAIEKWKSMLLNVFNTSNENSLLSRKKSRSISSLVFPSGVDPNVALDIHGHSALHYAAYLGRLDIIRWLLFTCEASTEVRNAYMETPLMKCVQSTDSWNHKEFPEVVKALGNSVMLQDKKGFTVLHHVVYAASKGKRIFSACNNYAVTLLRWALENNVLALLLGHRDNNGQTALDLACQHPNLEPFKEVFLQMGAKLRPGSGNSRDKPGGGSGDKMKQTRLLLENPQNEGGNLRVVCEDLLRDISEEYRAKLQSKKNILEKSYDLALEVNNELTIARTKLEAAYQQHRQKDKVKIEIKYLETAIKEFEKNFNFNASISEIPRDSSNPQLRLHEAATAHCLEKVKILRDKLEESEVESSCRQVLSVMSNLPEVTIEETIKHYCTNPEMYDWRAIGLLLFQRKPAEEALLKNKAAWDTVSDIMRSLREQNSD